MMMLLYIHILLKDICLCGFLHLYTNNNWNGDFVVISSNIVQTLLKNTPKSTQEIFHVLYSFSLRKRCTSINCTV